MNIKRLILALLLCLLPLTAAHAIEPTISFERYSNDQGLSQNVTYNIAQDNQGFMWFATRDGLNRFDGNDFRVFRFEPKDVYSISNNVIRALHVDSHNILWVGTAAGLNRFNPATERFTRYLDDDSIRAISEDSKGNLWIGTEAGLNRYDRIPDSFSAYDNMPLEVAGMSVSKIRAMDFDSKDNLWIGTWGSGLIKLHKKQKRFEHFYNHADDPYSLNDNRILSLAAGNKGKMWVGTVSGLNHFHPSSRRFKYFVVNKNKPRSLNHNMVLSLKVDSSGRLWVGSMKGLNRYQPIWQNFLDMEIEPVSGKTAEPVWRIFEDKQRTLWLATFNGVLRQLDGQQLFTHYNHLTKEQNSLSHNNVLSIHQTRKGELWLGTAGGGLNRLVENDNVWFKHHFAKQGKASSLASDQVFALHEDAKNNLWVGTSGGLNRRREYTDDFDHWQHDPSDSNSLSNNLVSAIYEDSKGQLWVGTFQGGLNRFEPSSNEFIRYTNNPKDPTSLSHDNVKAITEDAQGQLWVGTSGGGLNRFNPQTNSFVRYTHNSLDAASLSSNSINSLYRDNKGHLWIGTRGGGLNLFQPKDNTFAHFREKDGLSDDNVVGITQDSTGNLWLSTNRGLSRFSNDSKTFIRYDSKDGLQSNRFNVGALHAGQKGELFFGGVNGFNRFFPEKLQNLGETANILLTDLLVFNLSAAIKPEGDGANFALPKAISALDKLTLTHKENFVSIVFAALDFTNPGKVEYAYQLQGWDTDWVYVDAKNRRATYTNLPQGDYRFKLKAKLNHGQWHEQTKTFNIETLPPPWWTWWAKALYLLMVLVILGLLAFARLERQKRLNERHKALEQAGEAKSEFLAKMSHEMRTPMNAVIGLSRLTLKTKLDAHQKDHLEKVVDAGGILLGLINDILDFSKIEAGKLTIENTAFELNKLVQRAVTLSSLNAHNKGLELITDIDSNIPKVLCGDPLRLQQIIVNLVNNAVKFTESGAVCVKIIGEDKSTTNQLQLHCVVIDTGIGMNEQQQSKLFQSYSQADDSTSRTHGGTGLGLAISQELCELMGGKIWLKSTPDKGSEFHFTVLVDIDDSVDVEQVKVQKPAISDELSGLKVLVVEDVPMASGVLVNILTDLGLECHTADSGLAALKLINGDVDFDFALVDWSMPGLNGLDTIAKLNVPSILMVSTYERDEVGDTALLLEKPVSHASVYAAIMQLRTGEVVMVDESAEVSIPDLSGNHILLVDDNAINRQVALGFLADTGVSVDVAENGLIALASIQQQSYDLVLMDIEMPQMDGMTATGEIRGNLGLIDLPVIAMTAHAMASDIEKTKTAGMNDHVTKPVDPLMLYQCLAKYLEIGRIDALLIPHRAQSHQIESSLNLEQAHELLLAQLVKVNGLDSQKAVNKLNGRTALYLGLVKDFSLQQQSRKGHLMNLYDQQAWDELYRHVHSLKANTAYIGAYELSQMAAIVETAIGEAVQKGLGYSDEAQLQKLCDVLQPLVEQLKNVHFEQAAVDNETTYSDHRLHELLTKILPLLQASSFSVEDQLPVIVALCQGSEYVDKIAHLVHLVDDLEFEKAAELARLLLNELHH